ncbi:Ig-like domain-containing protein [Labilithrix luteola]|nr:zinc ribbon domain-containing protein [Labilithrix luteola]
MTTWAGTANADLQVDGRWRQSALSEEFTVQQWLPGCGPEPKSARTGGGEIIALRAEGDELAFVGGGRVFRTNQCYDPMPNLNRETHLREPNGKTWRTRCTTPANDPRKAILNTLVVVSSDTHVDVVETGRYEITLETGRCMADVKRTRSFDIVRDEAPATPSTANQPAAPKEPKPDPKPAACESPGAPSRLEVRPSQKLLRTGETFAFRPVVLDDKGCATKTSTTWQVSAADNGKGVSVDKDGKVTVASDAPEGSVEIVATAAGKSTRVTIQVTQPGNYDDLLARSGLNAAGENDSASSVSIGTTSIGAGEGRVEDRSKTRRLVFVAIIGGTLLVLGALALVLLRRSRRAASLEKQAADRHQTRLREALDRRQQREEAHASQQRAHEASLVAVEAATRAANAVRTVPLNAPKPVAAPEPELECPTCGKSFDAGVAFCPHDGVALIPKVAVAGAVMAKNGQPKRGKICPTCGDRFEGGADFCGKDGTQLVLLN